jgi:hypothetical protein
LSIQIVIFRSVIMAFQIALKFLNLCFGLLVLLILTICGLATNVKTLADRYVRVDVMHFVVLDPLNELVLWQSGQQNSPLGRIGRSDEKSRGRQIVLVIDDALAGRFAAGENTNGQKDGSSP